MTRWPASTSRARTTEHSRLVDILEGGTYRSLDDLLHAASGSAPLWLWPTEHLVHLACLGVCRLAARARLSLCHRHLTSNVRAKFFQTYVPDSLLSSEVNSNPLVISWLQRTRARKFFPRAAASVDRHPPAFAAGSLPRRALQSIPFALTRSLRAIAAASLALLVAAGIACGGRRTETSAPVLLFSGIGTSSGDVAALETILRTNHVDYVTVGSAELNLMAEDAIRRYRLLIFPGGNFVRMGNSLTPRTSANLRNAVLNGVNYLGVCAGAFLAGSFPKPYNSLNLTSGVQFGFYAAARDTHKTNVPVTVAGGPTLDQYWEDGPQLTGWGAVVARYPDGTPAVVEGTSGNGWVILTGVHPEAPESWRRGMMFRTPASTDNAYAATLIQAALNRTPLSHF